MRAIDELSDEITEMRQRLKISGRAERRILLIEIRKMLVEREELKGLYEI